MRKYVVENNELILQEDKPIKIKQSEILLAKKYIKSKLCSINDAPCINKLRNKSIIELIDILITNMDKYYIKKEKEAEERGYKRRYAEDYDRVNFISNGQGGGCSRGGW